MKKDASKEYELVIILRTNVSSEEKDAQEKSIEDLVAKAEGSVANKKVLGIKTIAYEVKKQREGQFLVWTVSLPASKVDSFTKSMILNDGVLKHTLTIKDHRLDNIPALKKRPQDEHSSSSSYARDVR